MAKDWSPDMDAALRAGLEERVSASIIAERLGNGITRNAVLGRIFRLGLSVSGGKRDYPLISSQSGVPRRTKVYGSKRVRRSHATIPWESLKEHIVDMRDVGLTWREIGENIGCRGPYAYLKSVEMGIHTPMEQHYFTQEDIQYICDEWQKNTPIEDIADHLNRSFGVIRQKIHYLLQAKIIERRDGAKTRLLKRYGVEALIAGKTAQEALIAMKELKAKALANALHAAHAAKHKFKQEAVLRMKENLAAGMDRNEAIFRARAEGVGLEMIAAEFDITRERVRQVCYKYAEQLALKELLGKKSK